MARKIEQEYRIKDKGSAELKKATSKVSKSLKTVEKTSNTVSKGMEASWKRLAGIVAGAFVFTEVVKGFQSITQAASDLQEVTSKFETVFAGQLTTAASAVDVLTDSYYLSTRAAREYLASVQDLLVPMGVASGEAANLSFEVVKLASDLGSFNNLQTEKVIADMQSALVGNFETMKKYGIVLNATLVEQKAYEMGLASTKDELTAGIKAQAAYQLMVEGSTAAIGDSERTAGSYANTLKRFKARVEDLSGSLGEALLPYLTTVIGSMADWIQKNEELIAQRFKQVVDGIAKSVEFLAKNMDFLIAGITAFAGLKIAGMLLSFGGGLAVATAATKTMTAATTSLSLQMKELNATMAFTEAGMKRYSREAVEAAMASNSAATATTAAATGVNGLAMALGGLSIIFGLATATWLLVEAAEALTSEYKDLQGGVEDLTDAMAVMAAVEGGDTIEQANETIKKTREKREELEKLKKAQQELLMPTKPPELNLLNIPSKTEIDKIFGFYDEFAGANGSNYDLDYGFDPIIKLIQEAELAQNNYNFELERSIKLQNAMAKSVEDTYDLDMGDTSLAATLEWYSQIEDEIVGFWARIGDAIKSAGLTIERASSIIADHSTDAIMELAAAGDSLSETWEKVKDGFADFAASILRDMARILIRAAIFNAAMKALGFMGGVGGVIASGLQGFFANGGHLKGNQPAVVGEQGPELFIPDGGGTIMSNAKSNRMMGDGEGSNSQVFNININRPMGSDEDARRQGQIIRDEMKTFFDRRLIYQSKPGGILRPSAAMR